MSRGAAAYPLLHKQHCGILTYGYLNDLPRILSFCFVSVGVREDCFAGNLVMTFSKTVHIGKICKSRPASPHKERKSYISESLNYCNDH